MSKKLPSEITSYDLLKTIAVITMIIDHIGYYFFPEQLIWRAVGRVSFPIWFFLIGYARSRDISMRLVIGAGFLAFLDAILGLGMVPLNVLFTIMVLRMIREPLMEMTLRNRETVMSLPVTLCFLVLPSFMFFEYGTQGALFVMLGYVARRKGMLPDVGIPLKPWFWLLAFATYAFQQMTFQFDPVNMSILAVCALSTMVLLYGFKAATYPKLTRFTPSPARFLIQLMGRRTLEIYVAHLVLFKVIALYLGSDKFTMFDWQWVQWASF